jgi:hypothetical protein
MLKEADIARYSARHTLSDAFQKLMSAMADIRPLKAFAEHSSLRGNNSPTSLRVTAVDHLIRA